MTIHTIRTRFTFGDRVRYESPTQRKSGKGKVILITFDETGQIDYTIDDETGTTTHLQPGIQEDEMTLLGDEG